MTLSLLTDIERHAAERPDSVAIATPGRSWTFAELSVAIGAVAARLRELGVKPRDVVGIDLPSGLEWILDLALFRLAARSVSLRGVADVGTLALDVATTAPGGRRLFAATALQVDELWIDGAVSRASGTGPLVDYPRPDSICRLILTSGTTGMPRAAAYSVAALESRRVGLDVYWTNERSEVDFMSLSTTGGFHTAVAALHHGQPFRGVDSLVPETLRFIAEQEVQVLAGSPMHIARALEIMAEQGIELPTLEEVRMAGAAPSATLLELIAERIGVPVKSIYGSTEGGGITMQMMGPDADPSNAGQPLPTLHVQVVDESGTPVAAGVEGSLRYRGPGLVSGYWESGAVTPFPGGWFVPGDIATLDADGSVHLAGRNSEIFNLAGMKIDPARIDERAITFRGVRDAAAFEVERRPGIPEVGLAVVADPGCDLRELDSFLRAQFRVGHPTAFWQVAEVPRNRMGKVERSTLAGAFLRATKS